MSRGALDPIYWPLMDAPTVKLPYCAVCGRNWPLNDHHIVWRSKGHVMRGGKLLESPTVTLCGNGSHLGSGGTAEWCHGKAHHLMLHFRNDRGRLECLETEMPTEYSEALKMEGWRDVCTEEKWFPC